MSRDDMLAKLAQALEGYTEEERIELFDRLVRPHAPEAVDRAPIPERPLGEARGAVTFEPTEIEWSD